MHTPVGGAARSALLYRDAVELPAGVVPFLLAVLADAAETHPRLVSNGVARPSATFAPATAVSRTAGPLPEPPMAAVFAFAADRDDRPDGRGLLMVHHLADLVRTVTGPGGTATRTYWRR